MSKVKCSVCNIFIEENEVFNDGSSYLCGDCAIKEIMKIHGLTEDQAYHILETIQFDN